MGTVMIIVLLPMLVVLVISFWAFIFGIVDEMLELGYSEKIKEYIKNKIGVKNE